MGYYVIGLTYLDIKSPRLTLVRVSSIVLPDISKLHLKTKPFTDELVLELPNMYLSWLYTFFLLCYFFLPYMNIKILKQINH